MLAKLSEFSIENEDVKKLDLFCCQVVKTCPGKQKPHSVHSQQGFKLENLKPFKRRKQLTKGEPLKISRDLRVRT
jgi:predicted metal-binding transcription factor (methanogenesis marker protein 9)